MDKLLEFLTEYVKEIIESEKIFNAKFLKLIFFWILLFWISIFWYFDNWNNIVLKDISTFSFYALILLIFILIVSWWWILSDKKKADFLKEEFKKFTKNYSDYEKYFAKDSDEKINWFETWKNFVDFWNNERGDWLERIWMAIEKEWDKDDVKIYLHFNSVSKAKEYLENKWKNENLKRNWVDLYFENRKWNIWEIEKILEKILKK